MSSTRAVRSGSRPVRSDAFVFFGATGDLAFKQIFPALAGLIHHDNWAMPIIGIARHGDLAALRDQAGESLAALGITDRAVLGRLQDQLRFINGSDDDPDTFRASTLRAMWSSCSVDRTAPMGPGSS